MNMIETPYLRLGAKSPYPLRWHLARLAWVVLGEPLFRTSPRQLYGFRRMLLRLWGARIAPGARFYPSVSVYFPWNLTAEGPILVGPRVTLYNLAPIALRRGCVVSQGAHLCSGTHDYERWDFPLIFNPVEIGENAWVCAETFIGPGVVVGELAVVGARAVVVKPVPARAVVVGNPARVVKMRREPV